VDKQGVIFQIKRMWFETFLLVLMGFLLYYTSGIDEPVLRLFAFKVLLFSASQLHAHITRHILFPYIKFNETENYQRGLIIAIHVSAAYLYAQGG
jgi:hypothetical protein